MGTLVREVDCCVPCRSITTPRQMFSCGRPRKNPRPFETGIDPYQWRGRSPRTSRSVHGHQEEGGIRLSPLRRSVTWPRAMTGRGRPRKKTVSVRGRYRPILAAAMIAAHHGQCPRPSGRRGRYGARSRHCAILAVGVMNHGPSTVGRAKRSRDFGGKPNKSISPLCALPVCRD